MRVIQRMADKYDYARGEGSLHQLWTSIEDVDHVASMRHCRKEGGVTKARGKHTFRLRNGDLVNNLMLHRRAKEGQKSSPYCPYGCKTAAGIPYIDSTIHFFLCGGSGARDITTTRHNTTCKTLDRGISKGYMARFLMLRNNGRTDGDPEQFTVPEWMQPGTPKGISG
jgi:hypothetical protein